MKPTVLKILAPTQLGTYLAIFATPSGTRAWRWGWPGNPRAWVPFGDTFNLALSGVGTQHGAGSTTEAGRAVSFTGKVLSRYDVRDLFARHGNPLELETEHEERIPRTVENALAELAIARREHEDHVADRDEITAHRWGSEDE